jgi:hypothetical protein
MGSSEKVEPVLRRFRLHWNDGKIEEGIGRDAANAFSSLGYGLGAVPALNFYEKLETIPVRINHGHKRESRTRDRGNCGV